MEWMKLWWQGCKYSNEREDLMYDQESLKKRSFESEEEK